jgi:hypothetical protein
LTADSSGLIIFYPAKRPFYSWTQRHFSRDRRPREKLPWTVYAKGIRGEKLPYAAASNDLPKPPGSGRPFVTSIGLRRYRRFSLFDVVVGDTKEYRVGLDTVDLGDLAFSRYVYCQFTKCDYTYTNFMSQVGPGWNPGVRRGR